MSDGDKDRHDPANDLNKASESTIKAISNATQAGEAFYSWLWGWFGDHQIVRWTFLTLVGYVVTQGFLNIAGWFYRYFFEWNVAVSRDIEVQTHPLPVGLSLNLLFVLWAMTLYYSFSRIVKLRKRMKKLETKHEVEQDPI